MILFNDRITAYHKEKFVNEDGSTQQRREKDPFVQRMPCQISYESNDRGTPKAKDRLPQARAVKVFVWLENIPKKQMFRRGDDIIFERLDEDGDALTHHEGTIGEPRVYTRGIPHVELSLEAEE